jgi:hypothetical protein
MQKYYTTSTAPGFSWQFTDQAANVLNVTGATFKLTYRCIKNFLKTLGGGSFSGTSQQLQNGQVQYALGATDMANAYALCSTLIDTAQFEVYATAIIGSLEYDALPVVIEIGKI